MQTRSSVLGKRHAPHEITSPSASTTTVKSVIHNDVESLPTPDATPNPKRMKLSMTVVDGDNNKENIPPRRVEPINSLTPTPRALRRNSTEQLSSPRQSSCESLPSRTNFRIFYVYTEFRQLYNDVLR